MKRKLFEGHPTMQVTTRIANRHLKVDVSAQGAEMQSLTTADGRSWLWDGDAAWWSGRSPVLFPMVGKSPNDRFSIDGTTYELPQHGFARRSQFILAASSEVMCRYELAASEATRTVYPFEFHLALTHSLDDRRLTVAAEVENRDVRPMPFGLGFHPAFRWPLPGASGRTHRIILDNGAEPAMQRVEGGLIGPRLLPSPFLEGRLTLEPSLFEADAMIFPEGAGAGLTYAADNGPALAFSFDNLPNLALWQKPGAPFICVEPWHGTAARKGGSDELAQRPYSVILPPGQTARFAFSVEVKG